MGTWGRGILQDDLASDVYSEFMDAYNKGDECSAISSRLLIEYGASPNELDEDFVPFWLALAKALWECGALDEQTASVCRQIVRDSLGLEGWGELDAGDRLKRAATVSRFVESLSTPRVKPRARRRKMLRPPIYKVGDCLAIRDADGMYTASLVTGARFVNTTDGVNFLWALQYYSVEKPTLSVFTEAGLLWLTHGNWGGKLCGHWCFTMHHKRDAGAIECIGNVSRTQLPSLPEAYSDWLSNSQQARLQAVIGFIDPPKIESISWLKLVANKFL
ncbi:MAG: hypothetical protein EAZ43_15305 [Betaproteobacteria bacterium]|nr:MAG: hypothetical protein EAZ43_15305 [Betaproteobacteria bacterium]